MAELLDVLNAFSPLVKVGWAVWLAAGLGLCLAYRFARVVPHAVAATVTAPRRRVVPAAGHAVSLRSAPVASSSQDAIVQSAVVPSVVMVESTEADHNGVSLAGAQPPAPSNDRRRRRRASADAPSSARLGPFVGEAPRPERRRSRGHARPSGRSELAGRDSRVTWAVTPSRYAGPHGGIDVQRILCQPRPPQVF